MYGEDKKAAWNPGHGNVLGIEEGSAHGDRCFIATLAQVLFMPFGDDEVVQIFIFRINQHIRRYNIVPLPAVRPCGPAKQRFGKAKQFGDAKSRPVVIDFSAGSGMVFNGRQALYDGLNPLPQSIRFGRLAEFLV